MVAAIIRFLMTNFTLTFLAIAFVAAGISVFKTNIKSQATVAEAFLSWYCFFVLGITQIYNAISHIVFHQMAARFIGWADSPFQIEVGFASLGMGILGIMAYKKDKSLRLAAVVCNTIFLWGAAAGHIYQIKVNQNFAPGNGGIILWSDFLLPLAGIGLLTWWNSAVNKDANNKQTQPVAYPSSAMPTARSVNKQYISSNN